MTEAKRKCLVKYLCLQAGCKPMALIALFKTDIWTKAQDCISVIVITIGF